MINIAKNIFDSDFSSLCFDEPKTWNFTSGGVQNRETKNRTLRMIVTSFQDFTLSGKQILRHFLTALSPGQTATQVNASWRLGSTCDFVWPGRAYTCVALRWLAFTLVEIKFARKSTQVFHRLATHPTQVNASWVTSINLLLAKKIEDSLP